MSSDVRFRINGKTYDTGSVDEISLRDVVLFNSQAAEIGLPATWADVERIAGEMASRTEADGPHPDALLMFAVTIWAARRIAGEDVSVGEAIDVPMSKIEILEARKVPKDRQPKKGAKKATAAGSVPAVVPAAPVEVSTTLPTSSELYVSGSEV